MDFIDDSYPFPLGRQFMVFDGLGYYLRKIERLLMYRLPAILHAGDHRDVSQQLLQTISIRHTSLQEFDPGKLGQIRMGEQGLEADSYGGYGCLQFVVDIIGQLLLDALFLALLEERGAMFEVAVGICLTR